MAAACARAAWRLVHAIFYFSEFLVAAFVSILWIWRQHRPTKLTRRPKTVALVIDSCAAREFRDKVLLILQWLSAADVDRVAVYDTEGVLKAAADVVLGRISSSDRRNRDQTETALARINSDVKNGYDLLSDRSKAQNGFRQQRKMAMDIEFLSRKDGKEALANVAQKLYEDVERLPPSQQEKQLQRFSEEDVNEHLLSFGYAIKDPELLLIFGKKNCLQGFPPWRLRITEIMNVGDLQKLSRSSFVRALEEYSGKTQRFGR